MTCSSVITINYNVTRRWFLIAIVGALVVLGAGSLQAAPLTGKYAVVANKTEPAPHSADVVVVEEFLNFSCPHCNDFREEAKPIFAKYGKRLKLVRVPILFRGQQDAALRLFYIAQARGQESEMDQALFDARFRYGVDNFDVQVVNYLARSNGLEEAYEKDAASEWVGRRISDGISRADTYGVEATPTLVLQGSLRLVPDSTMADFVANLDKLVGQLLK
jgi:protein-disulfide isomerase